jgi:hypothetical protein
MNYASRVEATTSWTERCGWTQWEYKAEKVLARLVLSSSYTSLEM